jgi:hypothetical protein
MKMMATYWNGVAADTYNRRISMTFPSWKLGRRILVVGVLIVAVTVYFLQRA